jgi:hypothetical protein
MGVGIMRTGIMPEMCVLAIFLGAAVPAWADAAKPPYPAMAKIEQYRMVSSEEISLARSAAPASISGEAEILTLGDHGYETALKGKNGFICLVERSWASGFDDAGFWNPKLRAPICHNPAAAHSILPDYLERTKWVLAGVSKADMLERAKSAAAANTSGPEPGALSLMLSKQGYLGDAAGHWHPHLMFYLAHTNSTAWGADLDGSPVSSSQGYPESITTFYVLVPKWSDGTAEDMKTH